MKGKRSNFTDGIVSGIVFIWIICSGLTHTTNIKTTFFKWSLQKELLSSNWNSSHSNRSQQWSHSSNCHSNGLEKTLWKRFKVRYGRNHYNFLFFSENTKSIIFATIFHDSVALLLQNSYFNSFEHINFLICSANQ